MQLAWPPRPYARACDPQLITGGWLARNDTSPSLPRTYVLYVRPSTAKKYLISCPPVPPLSHEPRPPTTAKKKLRN
jgi:hypothetical protein